MKIKKLLAIGLSMTLLLVSVPVYVSASSDVNEANIGRLIVGDYENPVSLESIDSVRATVNDEVESFIEKTDSSIPEMALTLPEHEEGEIVAYAFVVSKDGIPKQFVGTAGNEDSVTDVFQKASEWFEYEINASAISNEYNARGSSWITLGEDTDYYAASPYGTTLNHFILKYVLGDEDSTYDWYGVWQFHSIEPGCHTWGSDWINAESKPSHNWGWGDVEVTLASWAPTGLTNGSQSMDTSFTGGTGDLSVSFGWQWSHPDITTYDDTNISAKKAAWLSTFYGNSRYFACGIEPGSSCKTYQQTSGTYDLVYVESVGIFCNSEEDCMAVIYPWPISVIY